MKFFLDTANLNEIKKAISIGVLDGITTNPTLIAKESIFNQKNAYQHYISICKILDKYDNDMNKSLSAEVISNNFKDIVKEGEILSSLHPRIVVKIPMTDYGIEAINELSNKKIKTNCTLVFSTGQAILAAKAGASYISPFLGRLDDISYNGIDLIKEIRIIYQNYNFQSKILAASIRNPIHIIQCSKIGGIYAITSPLKIIQLLFNHPLTKIGLKNFLDDYNQSN